jgi:hypothetical protein
MPTGVIVANTSCFPAACQSEPACRYGIARQAPGRQDICVGFSDERF